MFNIKIEPLQKIDNLFHTKKSTPINTIKTKLTNHFDNIIKLLDTNLISDIYIGSVKNNKLDGEGLIIKKNKILIEGEFKNDLIENSNCILDNINLKGTIDNGDFITGTYNINHTFDKLKSASHLPIKNYSAFIGDIGTGYKVNHYNLPVITQYLPYTTSYPAFLGDENQGFNITSTFKELPSVLELLIRGCKKPERRSTVGSG